MNVDVWKPMYDENFDPTRYLYHYTNLDKAIKILHSESFIFSQIRGTNDTSESKLKISYKGDLSIDDPSILDEKIKKVDKFFKENIGFIRLLCFSMDVPIPDNDKPKVQQFLEKDHRNKFCDIKWRGFALPRMWAQYATNNEGVCFIVNKEKLDRQIKKKTAFYKPSKVRYNRFFESYEISKEQLDELCEKITIARRTMFTNMIRDDDFFVEYNFFSKSDDWINEHEFRYITAVDNVEDIVRVDGLFDYLEGVVVGESIDPAYKKVIELLLGKKVQVMNIVFGNTISKLI